MYTAVVMAILCFSCDSDKNDVSSESIVATDSIQTIEDLQLKMMAGDSSADIFFQRSQLYFKNGNLQGAADDIMSALRRDTHRVEFYHHLSDIQLNAYQSKPALESLQKAVSLDPQNRTSLLKLMELQILLKQYIPAVSTSQRLLTIDPQDYQVFFLRGLLFKEGGDDSLAIVNLQRCVDLNSKMTDAFIMLGDLHEKQSNPLAEGYYKNAVQSDPENMNAKHAYAFYLQNHNQPEKALDIYNEMIEMEDDSPAAYVNSALLYMDQDSFEKARDLLLQAKEIDTSFVVTRYYLGECYKALGDKSAARKSYEQAIKIDPEFVEAREALKDL